MLRVLVQITTSRALARRTVAGRYSPLRALSRASTWHNNRMDKSRCTDPPAL